MLSIIFGAALVTALPKIFPLVILKKTHGSERLIRFLNIIPYTSLTILILRGILFADPGMGLISLCAVGAAVAVAYRTENLPLTIGAAILLATLFFKLGIAIA